MNSFTIKLSTKEEKLLLEYSKLQGENISTIIKKLAFEKLKDEYDYRLANYILDDHPLSSKDNCTFEEFLELLDIED